MSKTFLADFFTGENRPMTEQRDAGCLHGVNPNGSDSCAFFGGFLQWKKSINGRADRLRPSLGNPFKWLGILFP
jgi:hypothetical protein